MILALFFFNEIFKYDLFLVRSHKEVDSMRDWTLKLKDEDEEDYDDTDWEDDEDYDDEDSGDSDESDEDW